MIASATGACIAVVVDDDLNRVDVVAGGAWSAVEVLDVADALLKYVFRSVSVPVKVRAVALPPTVTPPPELAVRLPPVLVESVTVSVLPPASTSLKLTAERSTLLNTSSVTLISLGKVPALVGSSLIAEMLIVCAAESSSLDPSPVRPGSAPVLPPSLTVTVIVVEDDGCIAVVEVSDRSRAGAGEQVVDLG